MIRRGLRRAATPDGRKSSVEYLANSGGGAARTNGIGHRLWPSGRRPADFAIVSSRPAGASVLVFGREHVLERGVIKKVGQIDSTIRQPVRDESRLTGHLAIPRRRYMPVLVVTEGFR